MQENTKLFLGKNYQILKGQPKGDNFFWECKTCSDRFLWIIIDICQRLRGRKIWVCPGGATQNLPLKAQRAAWERYQGAYTLPCIVVASYGLRNRDTQDFLARVMSDADVIIDHYRHHQVCKTTGAYSLLWWYWPLKVLLPFNYHKKKQCQCITTKTLIAVTHGWF